MISLTLTDRMDALDGDFTTPHLCSIDMINLNLNLIRTPKIKLKNRSNLKKDKTTPVTNIARP